MTEKEREIITTNQAAELLNVKTPTIHNYIKEGLITPIYKDHNIDKTKLFYKDEINQIVEKQKKPGLTTGEASKLLGLHLTTIYLYIQQGLLKAEMREYKGKEVNFINLEELERFKSAYEDIKMNGGKEFYDKKTNFAWFQKFKDHSGNSNSYLLLDKTGLPYLKTYDGHVISYTEIVERGFEPVTAIQKIGYKNKKGYAKFSFTESEIFYEIMNILYNNLGPKNMKVILDDNRSILVEVKPILIKGEISPLSYELLQASLVEGAVSKRHDGIYIDSDLEVITIAAPSKLKMNIKKDAEKLNMTMEEWVLTILNEKYKK